MALLPKTLRAPALDLDAVNKRRIPVPDLSYLHGLATTVCVHCTLRRKSARNVDNDVCGDTYVAKHVVTILTTKSFAARNQLLLEKEVPRLLIIGNGFADRIVQVTVF